MSTKVNDLETFMQISYAEYVMSAADAAKIASVLANSTRVERKYDNASNLYVYSYYTHDSHPLEIKALDQSTQARIAVQLSSSDH